MVGLLVIVLLVGAVVWGVRSSPRDETGDRSGMALRRLLQYLFLLVALFSAASGVTRILTVALPIGQRIAGGGPEELALGLSLTFVALPLWAILWRIVSRRLLEDADERASRQWSLYLAIATATSLIVALTNLVRVGTWAVGAGQLDARSVAATVVWGAVWGLHVTLLHRSEFAPTSTRPSLAVLAASAVGVVALALGANGVLSYGFGQAYQAIAGDALIEGATTEALRRSLVLTVPAAAIWWWHWLRQALHGPRSTPWHVYVLLVPVLGGLLVAVGFAAVALNAVLQWFFGDPEAARAAVHFAVVPDALAAALVGGWVWWYHLTVVEQVAVRERGEPERTYEYAAAAVGLIAAAVGIATAIVAAIQAVAPAPLAAGDPLGRNTMVVAVTLLLIGTPLWWAFWQRVQRRTRAGDTAELQSSARRAYLFLLFGGAGLTAAISVVVILFVVLRDLLEGSLDATVVYELRVAIALVLTTGGVSAYHWTVHSEDRAAMPEEQRRPPRHILLVSSDGRGLADVVAERTGANVRTLHRIDVAPGEPDAEAVAAAILASPHDRLLVTVDEDGTIRAIPYDTA